MKVTATMVAGLSDTLLSKNYDGLAPTPPFHFKMWDYGCSDYRQVAIAAPRAHSKSTGMSHAYTLAVTLWRERQFVVLVSETEGTAVQFLGNIKTELMENQELINLFKINRLVKNTETDIIVEFKDGSEFRIIAKGSGQQVRGLLWKGMRPDLILGDDMESDEQVASRERRQKYREWFYGALLPCLADRGIIRLVGTILHMDGLLENLMPNEHKATTIQEELCVYSEAKDPSWHSIKFRAHNSDFSEILWPERFPKKRLESIRKDYVDRGFPEGYSQEYLNYPIDDSTAFFKKDWMLPAKKGEEHEKGGIYIGTDFALSQKTKADFSVFTVSRLTTKGVLQIIDVIRERMDLFRIAETFFELQEKYDPETFIVEKGAFWLAIETLLTRMMQETGKYVNYKELAPNADKRSRAGPFQARMRAGMVQFDKEAYWYPVYESEMLRFDRDVHDDQVDATAIIGLALKSLIEAPSSVDVEEMRWSEELEESGLFLGGVDEVTGY